MSQTTVHIETISNLLDYLYLSRVNDNLIHVFSIDEFQNETLFNLEALNLNMFSIILVEDNGSNNDGFISFSCPNKTLDLSKYIQNNKGHVIVFSQDLIRDTPLIDEIDRYNFFSYDYDVPLTLTGSEYKRILDCFDFIKSEINKMTDSYSKNIVTSMLSLLFNLSNRYYAAKFNITAPEKTKHIVSQVNAVLKKYYEEDMFSEVGIPTVEFIAKKVNLSTNYLSDLLKKESGKSAKKYVNNFIIEKAKTLLVKDNLSVSELAYKLGFNYPHYFSRMFKINTGVTPNKYKRQH